MRQLMNIMRHWIAIPVAGFMVLLLGFGCATKPSKPAPVPPPAAAAPVPPPVQPPTNTPPVAVAPPAAATPAVYVPDMSHVAQPLPDGIIAWDELMKSTDA